MSPLTITITFYLAFLIAVSCSLLFTPLVRLLALCTGVVDIPGERKVHTIAVPRLGGLSIVISGLLTSLIMWGLLGGLDGSFPFDFAGWKPLLQGALIVFGVGIWDDIHPVPKWVKLFFEAIAAWVAVANGLRVEQRAFGDSYAARNRS